MNLISPRATRVMFVAAVVMTVLSVTLSAFSVATVLSAPLAAVVSVPNLVGFEGFLADANGAPLADGTYSITFALYDAATGGELKWSETHNALQVIDGLYAVTLGEFTSFQDGHFDGDRWIGVTVQGGSEMTPRTRVASVPFALNAKSANTVRGAAGMIALFEGNCPVDGWTEVASTQGRVVVGRPAGGVAGAQVGTALSNQGTRTITDVPAHTHGAGTLVTASAGSHQHSSPGVSDNWTGWHQQGYHENNYIVTGQWANGRNDVYAYQNADGSHTHSISGSTGSTGSTSVDVTMPYVQLVYCKLSP